MMNEINIKESCEYKWRMHQVKLYAILCGITAIVSFVLSLLALIEFEDAAKAFENFAMTFAVCVIIFCGVFIPFIIYYYSKARYLIKNYENFTLHTVMLDRPSTSWQYRGSIYYSVMIEAEDGRHQVDTSPIFSNGFYGLFDLGEYNNQSVRVLYDSERDRAYVIDKGGRQ